MEEKDFQKQIKTLFLRFKPPAKAMPCTSSRKLHSSVVSSFPRYQ